METVGVTTGVGHPYSLLAPLAAACFTRQTGIPSLVLGEKEFLSSGLPHPAALRLRAFEYVSAARIIYFDADWFCLQPWSLDICAEEELGACRDFILLDDWPRQAYHFDSAAFLNEPSEQKPPHDQLRLTYVQEVRDFASLTLPCHRWINTGFLILHRDHHAGWLTRGLQFYLGPLGHHPEYFEQPALLKALESVAFKVRLLARRMNVLAAYDRAWPPSIIGLHIKVKRHAHFVEAVKASTIGTPNDVVKYFQHASRAGGK